MIIIIIIIVIIINNTNCLDNETRLSTSASALQLRRPRFSEECGVRL
jgi:hypothetical protein